MEQETIEQELPVAVMNYRNGAGWKQTSINGQEWSAVQDCVRRENWRVVAQSIDDAIGLLQEARLDCMATAQNVLTLALFLSERRIPHISRTADAFLRAKVESERRSDVERRIREPEESGE